MQGDTELPQGDQHHDGVGQIAYGFLQNFSFDMPPEGPFQKGIEEMVKDDSGQQEAEDEKYHGLQELAHGNRLVVDDPNFIVKEVLQGNLQPGC